MNLAKPLHPIAALGRGLFVTGASLSVTVALFLVLPLLQSIASAPTADLLLQTVATTEAPPPPPPPEQEPEKPEKSEEKPPELNEAPRTLDLSQLELALNPGAGGGGPGAGEVVAQLGSAVGDTKGGGDDALFSMADLDQKPRAIYQPSPNVDAATRKKGPGTVYIVFVVDQQGRVEGPIVQKSSDPAFERPALAAVKQWKFEPGKRNGRAVRFRMRVPITFSQR